MKWPSFDSIGEKTTTISYKNYVTESGVGILWGKLAKTVISAGLAAIALGYTGVINASVSAITGLIGGIAGFIGDYFAGLAGIVIEPSAHAWAIAAGTIGGIPSVATPILTLAIVLGYLYIVWGNDG